MHWFLFLIQNLKQAMYIVLENDVDSLKYEKAFNWD